MKQHTLRFLLCVTNLVLVMTACSSPTPASRLPKPTPEPAVQSQAGSYPLVILRVVERQETRNGF